MAFLRESSNLIPGTCGDWAGSWRPSRSPLIAYGSNQRLVRINFKCFTSHAFFHLATPVVVRTKRTSVVMGEVKWTPELEVALFHSMHGHKPVGERQFVEPPCFS